MDFMKSILKILGMGSASPQHSSGNFETEQATVGFGFVEGTSHANETDSAKEIDLIEVVNDLQNKLAASGHYLDISLPQIVVIGCQSAGKSSVLERFVGKEFLPRGTGCITRRPIIVQLNPFAQEYAVFLGDERKFTDFNDVREEIHRLTEEECGKHEFSRNPITLQIYSPKVLKLTVVDLPGIIRVAVGDQSDDAVENVRNMVLEHIKKENTIILAITPMSQDIANSDALEVARLVDSERKRTIGVLTKLDVEGADASDILDNTQLFLKKGWVGVINRSPKDVEAGKDMDYIEKREKTFFKNSQYNRISHRMGIPFLQRLLQKTLRMHIKEHLPLVRIEIYQHLSKVEKELQQFNATIGEGPEASKKFMMRLLHSFADDINKNILGYSMDIDKTTLKHGAIINSKLHTEVQGILDQTLIPNKEEIGKLIHNMDALRDSISVPSLVMNVVCKELIERFKGPLFTSVGSIKETLLEAVKDSAALLDSCSSLKQEVLYMINQWIETEAEKTKKRLEEFLDTEMFFINTGHPHFHLECVTPPAGPKNVWQEVDRSKEFDPNTFMEYLSKDKNMERQKDYLAALSVKYLEIIQIKVSDTAIKFIAYFLVGKILEKISDELQQNVFDFAKLSSIVEELDDEIRRKEELIKTCKVLKEALAAIKSF